MQVVNIHEAKTHLSRLVEDAAEGREVIIAKAGRPIAKLVPFSGAGKKRRLGALRGRISVSADFDAPLPDDVLATFER